MMDNVRASETTFTNRFYPKGPIYFLGNIIGVFLNRGKWCILYNYDGSCIDKVFVVE